MNYFFLLFCLIAVIGCEQKSQVRHYTEVAIHGPVASVSSTNPHVGLDMGENPHAGLDMSTAPMMATANAEVRNSLTWKLPSRWQEQPANGMRLATFHLASDPQKIDCSIVALGRMAGGLEANLSRWMGQIGLESSTENLQQLINSSQNLKTQDGQEAKIYDFISIQKDAPTSDQSMITAIISSPEVTIFVKMTGSIEAVSQNRNSFLELVKSLHHQ